MAWRRGVLASVVAVLAGCGSAVVSSGADGGDAGAVDSGPADVGAADAPPRDVSERRDVPDSLVLDAPAPDAPPDTFAPLDAPALSDAPGAIRVVDLALEIGLTCALMSDGTVRCRGGNYRGSLGNGTTASSWGAAVTVTGLADATGLVVGIDYACALRRGGTVACWGANYYGQLGDGTLTDRLLPTPVRDLVGITQVAAGTTTVCARTAGSDVYCWGHFPGGRAATRPTALPELMEADEVVVTGVVACIRIPRGAVQCRELTFGRDVTTAAALAAGRLHICARLTEGSARCWGSNAQGQLGDGTTTARYDASVDPELRGIEQLVAGGSHTCALLADGTVWCWGDNWRGQLGLDPTSGETCVDSTREPVSCRRRPTLVPGLRGVVRLAAGGYGTCAIRSDGSVVCFGSTAIGTNHVPTPVAW